MAAVTAALIAGALLLLAALDGAFAGFRSSCGRTGLVDHRRDDVEASLRGLALAGVLLLPVVLVAAGDVVAYPERLDLYVSAGRVLLTVYLPYAGLILGALACYRLLAWRRRFLASSLILGPFTLARPLVALGGAAAAGLAAGDPVVGTVALVAAAAVLAVEPVADRRWYGHPG
jgi:hypothetical protein